jgi:hypothetical protein
MGALMELRVLVVGLRGLGLEIAKNLCLVGPKVGPRTPARSCRASPASLLTRRRPRARVPASDGLRTSADRVFICPRDRFCVGAG